MESISMDSITDLRVLGTSRGVMHYSLEQLYETT